MTNGRDFRRAIANIGAIVEAPSFYGYLSGYDNLKLMANLLPLKTKYEDTKEFKAIDRLMQERITGCT